MAVERGGSNIAAHKYHFTGYPTIRLYQGKDQKHFKDFEFSKDGHELTKDNFYKFLAANGVEMSSHPELSQITQSQSETLAG